MKKKSTSTPDEWERRLASILDKSRSSLLDINAKYERRSKHNALCGIENLNCGPHQRAAIEAFHATVNIPSSDDEVYRSVEPRISKYVDDKLVVKARAIDALRDQITALTDDIHQLAKDSTRTTKAVSHQDRRLDRLSNECQSRQDNLSNIEASISNEKEWRGKIEVELVALVESTRQQRGELDNKADLTNLLHRLESVKLETTNAITSEIPPLQASIKRDINTLKESMKEEVSRNIQPFQANMMETLKVAVEKETKLSIEKELDRLQGCIESFNKSKGKVQAFVTSAVETAEKNLQGDIEASLKDVKGLKKDVGLLRRSVRDDVATDLTTLKEELAQITMKQSEFMSALNSSESCRNELSSSLKEGLREIKAEVTSRSKAVDDALATIKMQIEEFQALHREETSRQEKDTTKLFERVSEMEKNLLKISRQYPSDDNILSEKVDSLAQSKIQQLEEKMRVLENKQSEFMSALNSSESCRNELSSSLKEGLREIKAEVTSRSKAVDDALATIKMQIEEFQALHREETSRQEKDTTKLFERVSEMEKNLLKISRQYPSDDNILSEKVDSLAQSKIQQLEEKMRVLENSQSSINIKESEVWRETLKLVEDDSRRRSIVQLGRLDEEEEEDKRNISEERNRTLSDVARKVLAVASRRGHDPSLIELAKRMQGGKLATPQPQHPNTSREEVDSSPESVLSILTSEALSLCGIQLQLDETEDDDEVETPRTDSPTPEPLPSRSSTPSPTQLCVDSLLLNKSSTPEVATSKECDATKPLKEESPIKVYSLSKTVEVDQQPPFTVKEEDDESDISSSSSSSSSSSIEGSITSYDEIMEVPSNNKSPLPTSKEEVVVDHGYNPTRLSNPEPYQGWDSLLSELRASGLILRDDNNEDESLKEDESSESSDSYESDFESDEDDDDA